MARTVIEDDRTSPEADAAAPHRRTLRESLARPLSWVGTHRWEVAGVVALLVVAALVRYPTLRQPLMEAHGFRQTQTAFTARIFHETGIDLLHPEMPVLGEPWEVPFEFPLFQAVASVFMAWGLSADVAMRVTSLGFFILTAALVWGLTRYATRRPVAAFGALIAFAFSPHALLWGRASLIEYMATAGAVGFAFAAVVWLDRRTWWWAALAVVAGGVGMLVKPTTAAFWILPVAGWTVGTADWAGWRDWARRVAAWIRRTARPTLIAIVVLPFVPALLWTRHADAIKAASFATDWLTEDALREWNFGTLAQRKVAANWTAIFDRAESILFGRYGWGALMVIAVVAIRRHRWFWVGVAGAAVLPVVVFFNLYFVHDYYLAAVSPAVAMLLGAGAGWIHSRWNGRRAGAVATCALAVGWLVPTLWTTSSYWRTAWQDIDRAGLGGEIGALTKPGERVVIVGEDWSPHILYYAERRGLMLAHDLESPEAVEVAHRRGYEYVYALDSVTKAVHLAREWPWIGVRGSFLYRVGDEPGEVVPASVLGTMDAGMFDVAARQGEVLADEPVTVTCGTPVGLPRGPAATWIRLGGVRTDAGRVGIGDGRAWLPDVEVLVVPTTDPAAPLVIECAGVATMTVAAVVAGPPPETLP